MKFRSRLRRKYFLKKLQTYLLFITLPIFIVETSLVLYYKHQMQKELSSYAQKSKDYQLYNINSILNILTEQTQLFSSIPSLALAVSKLQNQETLDYKNSIYKSLIFSTLSSSAHLNEYVDTIYVYFNNPYGNFFSSAKEYANINFPDCMDKDWLSIYQNKPLNIMKWVTSRDVKYFSFETAKNTISIFRRFYYLNGIEVINLNTRRLTEMLSYNQIYEDAFTVIIDYEGNILSGEKTTNLRKENVNDTLQHNRNNSVLNTVKIERKKYIFFTSTIPEYNLRIITYIPEKSVFQTLNSMLIAFSIMFFLSVLLSFTLSSLITRNNFLQLENLLTLFKKEEKNIDYAQLLKENSKNDYDIIFNNIVKTFIDNNRLQLNLAEEKLKEKDARLAALQLQINPHFIFNTLQIIDLEILRYSSFGNHVSILIHNLSDIFQYSLQNTFKSVTFKEEIEICKIYAEIEKFSCSSSFKVLWDYEEEILQEKVIHLIIQPFLENSIHHGIKEVPHKGIIKISIKKKENLIQIKILDNGIGINENLLKEIHNKLENQKLDKTSHIGIFNTNSRLVLSYGNEASIRIKSKKNMGTCVSFSFNPGCALPGLSSQNNSTIEAI